MNKLIKKITIIGIFITAYFLTIPNCVKAITLGPTFSGKYDRGITRISWTFNYNNGSYYESYMKKAIKNWMQPGWDNPIVFVAASSTAGTMMDVYTNYTNYFEKLALPKKTLAVTLYFNAKGKKVDPDAVSKYRYTEIHINDDIMKKQTDAKIQGTLAHELGHTFGLKHTDNVNSIMCQTRSYRAVETVQKIDNDTLVAHYK